MSSKNKNLTDEEKLKNLIDFIRDGSGYYDILKEYSRNRKWDIDEAKRDILELIRRYLQDIDESKINNNKLKKEFNDLIKECGLNKTILDNYFDIPSSEDNESKLETEQNLPQKNISTNSDKYKLKTLYKKLKNIKNENNNNELKNILNKNNNNELKNLIKNYIKKISTDPNRNEISIDTICLMRNFNDIYQVYENYLENNNNNNNNNNFNNFSYNNYNESNGKYLNINSNSQELNKLFYLRKKLIIFLKNKNINLRTTINYDNIFDIIKNIYYNHLNNNDIKKDFNNNILASNEYRELYKQKTKSQAGGRKTKKLKSSNKRKKSIHTHKKRKLSKTHKRRRPKNFP